MANRDIKPEVAPPNRVPRYTPKRRVGSVGFGAVYEARSTAASGVIRAVKILDPLQFSDLEDGKRRFLREGDVVARLVPRAIVPFVAADFTNDGVPVALFAERR